MIDKSTGNFENSKGGHLADLWAQRYDRLDNNPAGHSREYQDLIKSAVDHKNSLSVADGFTKLEDKRLTDRNNLAASYFGGDPVMRRAQASLVQAGYDLGHFGVKGVDGQIGPKTSKAIADYQKSIGLEPTGKLDQETMKSLDLTTASGLKKSDIDRMGKSVVPDPGLKQNNSPSEHQYSKFMDEAKTLTQKLGDTSKAIRYGIEHGVSKEAVGFLIDDYNKEHKSSFTFAQWKEKAKQEPIDDKINKFQIQHISNYEISLNNALEKQMQNHPQTQINGKWSNANRESVRNYLDPNNHSVGSENYQFLDLSASAGISLNDMTKYLSNKGILCGQEGTFFVAAKRYNVSEVYLAAHAALETGNGNSPLSNGVVVNGVKVYNMYGIGAFDNDPVGTGSQFAYKMGWTTPEKAIEGGAKWISEHYINNTSYRQNTLYKMRWNPDSPGNHQYATDIGWAVKQTISIKKMYDNFDNAILKFDRPKYSTFAAKK